VDFSTTEIPARQATKLTRRRFLLELVHHRIREEGYRRDAYTGEMFVGLTSFKDTDDAREWGLKSALRQIADQLTRAATGGLLGACRAALTVSVRDQQKPEKFGLCDPGDCTITTARPALALSRRWTT